MNSAEELAKAWFDAFDKGNMPDALLHDEFTHTNPFGTIEGKDAYLQLVADNKENFFNNTMTIVDTVSSGDSCWVRYVINDMAACDCIYVSDGKIKSIYSYYHFGDKPTL